MKSLMKIFAMVALLILCTPLFSQSTLVKKFLDEINISDPANKAEAYLQVAEKLFNIKKYNQAILVSKQGLLAIAESQDEAAHIRMLEIIGNSFNNLDLKDSAMLYFNKALNIAQTASEGGGMPDILKRIAEYYENNGEIQAAIQTTNEALRINKLSNNQDAIAENFMTLGNLYKIIGEYNKALDFYNEAKEIRLQTADEKKLMESMNNIGSIYFAWGEYDNAISEFNRCLIISEKLNLKEHTANTLNNIGVVYYVTGEANKSEEYFQRAKSIHESLGDENVLAVDYNNLGSFYLGKKQYDSAQSYFNKALVIHDKLGQKFEKIEILANIALVHKDENRFTESLRYINKALKLANESGNKKTIAILELSKGRIYIHFKNQEKAIEHFNQSIEIASKHNLRMEMMTSLKSLSEIYDKKNNAAKALEYYKKYYELKDSMFSESSQKTIAELEARYQNEKNTKKIEELYHKNSLQQAEMEATRYKLVAVIVIVGFILLATVIFFMYYRARQNQKALKLEQKLLRIQMNPHFIFNALSSIQGFVMVKSNDLAFKYLVDFSRLLRYILESSRVDFIPLESEIKTIKNYINLQSMLSTNNFKYKIMVDEGIDLKKVKLPPLLTQPFIENSIKHGDLSTMEDACITIRFMEQEGNYLRIEVEDNGIGIEKSKELKKKHLSKHNSMALNITKERLNRITKKEKKINLEIIDLKTIGKRGTKVTLTTPTIIG